MNKIFSRFKRGRLNSDAKELLMEMICLLVAFLFSSVKFFFGTYPFALAFCASCKRHLPFSAVGTALGTLIFIPTPLPYLITLLALIGLRLVGSLWLGDNGGRKISLGARPSPSFISSLFCEKVSVRVAISTLCAFGISIWRVVLSGYAPYDIFVLIFHTVLSAIVTYALCTLFEDNKDKRLFGYGIVLFIFIYMVRGFEVFSLDISLVLSYAVVLYASRYISGVGGASLGALLGICHGVAFAPAFALCGLISSLLWDFSDFLAIISALVMSIGYGIFSSGYTALVDLTPELLLASLVMYPLCHFEVFPSPMAKREKLCDGIIFDARSLGISSNLNAIARSFEDISGMISDISKKVKEPDREFWKSVCLEIYEKHCYSCPKRSICWERDVITTNDNIARMSEMAFCERVLSTDFADERFLHRCPNISLVIDEVNVLKRELETSKKQHDRLDVSAKDYELISKLIDGICDTGDFEPNPLLNDKAERTLKRIGVKFGNISSFGKRSVRIIATNVDTGATKCSLGEIKDALEEELGLSLLEPSLDERDGVCFLTVQSTRELDIESVKKIAPLDESEGAGDTLCAFFSPDDKYYMLLCDGMGSGRDALFTSSICAEFMQKILSSCADKELCLAMLNNFIRAKGIECSSSVDLLEIDLITGASCLVKSGAAPSFVKRGENIFRLHSKTAPIGIMKNPDAERLDFQLREGDIVVMVSDGIASDEKDSGYLVDFLSSIEVTDSESEESSDKNSENATQGAKETLRPANKKEPVSIHTLRGEINSVKVESENTATKKVPILALAETVLALAEKKRGARFDDMSVGVVRVKQRG